MAIDLKGVVVHDAEILVTGDGSIFITSTNPKLLAEVFALPFQSERLSDVRAVVKTGSTDAIAVAERIAVSWEKDGFKVNRVNGKQDIDKLVQSYILP